MPTEAQSKLISRLTAGPAPQPPIPTVPQLSDKIAIGNTEEKLAAIKQFNADLIEFFKKSGTIQQ